MSLKACDRPAECEKFAREFIVDRDPVAAYLRAHPRASWGTAVREGPRLARRPDVQALLAAMRDRDAHEPDSGHTSGGQDLAVLVSVHQACAYCHGRDHRRQRTRQEMQADRRAHRRDQAKMRGLYERAGKIYRARPFDPEGGDGFDPTKPPHPQCPSCLGHGVLRHAALNVRTGRGTFLSEQSQRARPQPARAKL
ncbi:hypothetical protein [Ramlibacter sp.]|uniref:hypothetical protein n=1 Tax=Ramlibacter sp. TaxID=1917967 RepID=UPI0026357D3C|nr:hypothetical protein [Ramlibacter sp.]MDB5957523.1 terminase small subunit [Ramlibacter sp.]